MKLRTGTDRKPNEQNLEDDEHEEERRRTEETLRRSNSEPGQREKKINRTLRTPNTKKKKRTRRKVIDQSFTFSLPFMIKMLTLLNQRRIKNCL